MSGRGYVEDDGVEGLCKEKHMNDSNGYAPDCMSGRPAPNGYLVNVSANLSYIQNTFFCVCLIQSS